MATLSIVEHLYVLEQIGSGFVSVAVPDPDDPFSLENTEEALDDGVVITVAGAAHAAVDAVPGQFVGLSLRSGRAQLSALKTRFDPTRTFIALSICLNGC